MVNTTLINLFLKFTKVKRIKREGDIAAYYPNGVRALQTHQLPKEFINGFNDKGGGCIRDTIKEFKPNFFRIEEFGNDLGDLFTQVLRLLGINNIRGIEKDKGTLNKIAKIMNQELKNDVARRVAKDRDYFENSHFMGQAMTKGQVLNILETGTYFNLGKVDEAHKKFVDALGMKEFEDGHKINKSFTNYLMRYLLGNTQKLGFILKDSEKGICFEKLILFIITAAKRDSHGIKNTFLSFTRQKKGKQRTKGQYQTDFREGRPGLGVSEVVYTGFSGGRVTSHGDSGGDPFVTFSNRTKKASGSKKGKKSSKAKRTTKKSKD